MKQSCRWIITVIFLLVYPAAILQAQTKIRLHDQASDVAGYKNADLLLGPGNTTAVTNTAASGTDIQVTKTGGGTALAWITPPFQAAVTLSSTLTCNIYAGESASAANSALRCRLFKYSGGSEGAAIVTANMTTELSTSTTTVRNWTGTVSSTVFAAGDRLVIKLFLENCATSSCPTGTMGGSATVTVGYDGTTDGSNAASWIQTTQTISFAPNLIQSSLIGTDTVTAVIPAIATFVTAPTSSAVNNGAATTGTWTPTAGNMIACAVGTFNQTVTTVKGGVSGAQNETFINVLGGTNTQNTPGGGHEYLYYLGSTGGGANYSVTANVTGSTFATIVCEEFHPASGALTLDVTGVAQPNNTQSGTVTVNSVTNNDMLLEASSYDDNAAVTAGAGYTLPTNGSNTASGVSGQPSAMVYDLQVLPGGNTTATTTHGSGNVGWATIGAAFKLAVAASAPITETVTIGSDSVTQLKGFGGPITETDTIGSDSVVAVAVRNRGITENTTVSDSLATSGGTAVTYAWSHITTPIGMPVSKTWNFALNYDDAHQCLLTFDGADGLGGNPIYSNSMFCYNSTTHSFTQLWTSAQNTSTCTADTSTNPENRHPYAQHAWDATNKRYYETSGSCNGALGYDMMYFTPTSSAGSWTQLSIPGTNTGVRQESQMVFVPGAYTASGHDSIMMFGGLFNASNRNDTWMYDISANTWTEVCDWSSAPVCSVPIHGGAYLAWDNYSKRVILTGGYNGSGSIVGSTWTFNPATGTDTWTQPTLTTDLPASAYPCAAYDTNRSRLVVLANNSQLWEYRVWKGTWTQVSTSGGPTLTANTFADSCGYDPGTDKFIFWDSQAGNGLWELAFGFFSGSQSKSMSETITTSDSIAIQTSGSKIITENNTVTPSVTRAAGFHSGVSESLTTSSSSVSSYGPVRGVTETATIGTDSATGLAGSGKNPTETLTTTPSVSAFKAHSSALSETIAVTPSVSEVAALRVTLPENMPAVSSGVGTGMGAVAVLSENLSTVASLSRSVDWVRNPVPESHVTSDSISSADIAQASISEAITTADAVTKSVQAGNVNRSISETFTPSDSVAWGGNINRPLSESLTSVGTVTANRPNSKSLVEAVTTLDTVSRSVQVGNVNRPITETILTSVQVVANAGFNRSLTTSLVTVGSTTRHVDFAPSILETSISMDSVSATVRRRGEKRRVVVISRLEMPHE